MSKLFIANAKLQTELFTYRIPDSDTPRPGFVQTVSRPIVIPIGSGEQVMVPGDLSTAQVDAIIDQHRIYGLIEVSQIDRTRVFSGLCYSVDRQISAHRIQELMTKNIDVLEEMGRESRKLAAIAISNSLEGDMAESRIPGQLRKLETEVVEVRDDRSNSPEKAPERIRVTDDETTPAKTPPRTRSRKAA